MLDTKIINLIRSANSDKALNELYRHFPMIRKMILSKGGTTNDAEDIFQEALIILCRKIKTPDFQLTSQLSTYLFGVSRFLWKDELKKRKQVSFIDFETGLKDHEEKELGEITEQEERARQAEKIINGLGDRCRELLLLFYKSKMKLKDIAAKMGYSSENTAKNQKYKCIEAARTKLKEMNHSNSLIH